MHRRTVPSGSAAPSSGGASSLPGKPKRRRRRNNQQSLFRRNQQDTLILLVQTLSYLILIVCGLCLALKVLFGYNVMASSRKFGSNMEQHHQQQFASNEERIAHDFLPLSPSRVYTVPESMPHIGDKTDEYASLRKEFDSLALSLPEIPQRFNFDTMVMEHSNSDQVGYDIYDCPANPPPGYPFDWNMLQILESWPPDDPSPRSKIFQGLCVFDFEKDYDKAMNYRTAEVPFVVVNDPEVKAAAKRWNAPNYMERMMSDVKHRTEYSENNHFMYWQPPRKIMKKNKQGKKHFQFAKGQDPIPKDWHEPTKMMRMAYAEWLEHANVTDLELGPDKPHWYYRLIGCGETGPKGECDKGSSEYLYDELTFFQPKPGLYLVEHDKQKGIHCRFGMKGVIAENHFDGSRNSIVVLGGERRYILSHPNQCQNLALLPKGHPSARHSAVNWSDPDLETYPQFKEARGNEVVLQAGDVLYLPTNWFHYIISLSLNFQCNTRSGIDGKYMPPIHECGF
mmetsp:Transcript_28720/g.69536  ORF Transcript_28720/g.69536 Transcript_28720/m.69536 type:complete len:509 (+) Transcript_28720:371-1897(+)|eukprot:CAMPEP_0113646838 /NCGR_PEP_ID=MMETSP0017_2-20120614/24760_1 /TAXON_ID=2856 /ORGANISM="Cylindrotheca closterium" /LENGTH=508 /DNA_ID=CAMNT_0000558793 /DNA_START=217 /DNA_END=1743 /DNA_ORIENTATION=- /assembly_acc=CAM_ASM_000147